MTLLYHSKPELVIIKTLSILGLQIFTLPCVVILISNTYWNQGKITLLVHRFLCDIGEKLCTPVVSRFKV